MSYVSRSKLAESFRPSAGVTQVVISNQDEYVPEEIEAFCLCSASIYPPRFTDHAAIAASVYSMVVNPVPVVRSGLDLTLAPELVLSMDALSAILVDFLTLQVLTHVDGSTTIEQILAQTVVSRDQVLAIISDLLDAHFIELRTPVACCA